MIRCACRYNARRRDGVLRIPEGGIGYRFPFGKSAIELPWDLFDVYCNRLYSQSLPLRSAEHVPVEISSVVLC